MAENEENYIKKADEMISDESSGYFAAKPADKCVNTLKSKTTDWYNTLENLGYYDKLRDMYAAWHGAYNNSVSEAHQISFAGQDGEFAEIAVNHLRNIGDHMFNMVTSVRPAMECRAINTDAKSQVQTKLGNGLLDYYMRASGKGLEERLKLACEYAICLGAGWIKMSWNPNSGEMTNYERIQEAKQRVQMGEEIEIPLPEYEGDAEFKNLSPFDIIEDLTNEDIERDWIIARSSKNKFDLIKTYPHLADELNKISPKSKDTNIHMNFTTYSGDATDEVFIYEFYHRRTESLPDGRYILYCDDKTIMYDGPLPYRQIPLFSIKPARILGTPLGYTNLFDILPIQDAVNSLHSTILTNNTAFGVQTILNPTGNNLQPEQISDGLAILSYNPQAGAPEALQLTSTAPETYNYLNMLIQSEETISGINSVVRGNPEASLRSGSAIAMVKAGAIEYMSGLQSQYINLAEDVGLGLLNMLIDFADSPRIANIVGESGKNWVKTFKGEDLRAINRVIVDSANPLTKSIAGRAQMADNLLQYGEITSKQYMNVVATGNLETATDNTIFEEMAIKDENESMLNGDPVTALAIDMHYEHITAHRGLISDPAMRKDGQLVKLVLDHIQDHITQLQNTDPNLLMALGMQPIQSAQPAPPAGAPGANPMQEPNPAAEPPMEQAIAQTGAQPQDPGARLPEGFENSPLNMAENAARIQGEE